MLRSSYCNETRTGVIGIRLSDHPVRLILFFLDVEVNKSKTTCLEVKKIAKPEFKVHL